MKLLPLLVIIVCAAAWTRLARAENPAPDFGPTPDLSNEVWYQIMPIAWRDSGPAGSQKEDPHRFGDLKGITAGLDYVRSMGFTGIWLTPPFPSKAYHGYQHGPADAISDWLGTMQDWRDLVQACHDRDMKIFVDFVAYGISTDSVYFKDAFKNPESKYSSWLAFKDSKNTTYRGYSFKTWSGDSLGIIWWDLRKQEPRELVTNWARALLVPTAPDRKDGIDGFRLDHVWKKYNPPEEKSTPDGWGYNLDSFWTPWKLALRKEKPGVITFAEQAQWETTGAALLGPFDAAFTKPIQTALRTAVQQQKAAPLHEAMLRTLTELNPVALPTGDEKAPAQPSGPQWLSSKRNNGNTFLCTIGDHDVDRIASVLGFDETLEPGRAIYVCKAIAAAQMFQPFPPIVYMGDEIGMRGKSGNFNSDSNDIPRREPFKWNAVDSKPMTGYLELDPRTVAKRFSKDNDGLSVQEQLDIPGGLLETYRELISIRHRLPALSRGSYLPLQTSSPAIWCFARRLEGTKDAPEQTVIVTINLSQPPQTFTIDLGPLQQGAAGALMGAYNMDSFQFIPPPSRLTLANQNAYPLTLPSYGVAMLVLQ